MRANRRLQITFLLIGFGLMSCSNEQNCSSDYIKSIHQRIFDIVQYHDRSIEYMSIEHEDFIEKSLYNLAELSSKTIIESGEFDSVLTLNEMSTEYNELNVIDRNGIIIKSTNENNVGTNEFDVSVDHKRFIKSQFESQKLLIEKYNEEDLNVSKTSYITSQDSEVVYQLITTNLYLDKESKFVKKKIKDLSKKDEKIQSIKLFHFNVDGEKKSADIDLPAKNLKVCDEVFLFRKSILRGSKIADGYTDTEEIIENVDGVKTHFVYSYVPRTDLIEKQNTILQLIWKEVD